MKLNGQIDFPGSYLLDPNSLRTCKNPPVFGLLLQNVITSDWPILKYYTTPIILSHHIAMNTVDEYIKNGIKNVVYNAMAHAKDRSRIQRPKKSTKSERRARRIRRNRRQLRKQLRIKKTYV